MLVRLSRNGDRFVPDRYLRQSDLTGAPASDRAAWKTVATTEDAGDLVVPQGSIGYRWPKDGEPAGRWNLEAKDGETGAETRLALSLIDRRDDVATVAFPYFGGDRHEHFTANDQGGDVLDAQCPGAQARSSPTARSMSRPSSICCAPITGSTAGSAAHCAKSFDDNVPYTPAWQAPITGVSAEQAIAVARGFAEPPRRRRAARW